MGIASRVQRSEALEEPRLRTPTKLEWAEGVAADQHAQRHAFPGDPTRVSGCHGIRHFADSYRTAVLAHVNAVDLEAAILAGPERCANPAVCAVVFDRAPRRAERQCNMRPAPTPGDGSTRRRSDRRAVKGGHDCDCR